jgi:hypothetical protein
MVNNACEQAQSESPRGAVLMARPATAARKRPAAKATVPRASKMALARLDGLSSDQKVVRLMDDRERLAVRVRDLEAELALRKARHAEVADRVAWALDLLKDVMAAKP